MIGLPYLLENMEVHPNGFASGTFNVVDEHLNQAGVLHGGITSGLMDAILGRAASCHLGLDKRRMPITLSLSLNFVGSSSVGLIYMEAKTTGGGKRTCFCDGRIKDSDGNLIVTAQGAFKLLEPGPGPGAWGPKKII
jgi:uncharacterized protein (TIGR00369 family)